MKLGFDDRRHVTGAGLHIRILQIAALLPVPYFLLVPSYPAMTTRSTVFSLLFDLGFSALPRWEVWGLSWLYRVTTSEMVVFFTMLLAALALGLAAKTLLGRSPRAVRLVLAALVAVDLVLRLLPLGINTAFGLPCAVCGFAVRLAGLALLLLDLRAAKRTT